MLQSGSQPGQEARRWDDHVRVYEEVFEPFALQFAHAARSQRSSLQPERIGFAPGMAAMMAGLGHKAPAAMERFVANLKMRLGQGPISLSGVAFIGTAAVP
jgi:hypothetical protein